MRINAPELIEHESFTDAAKAVDRLEQLYTKACTFLSQNFSHHANGAQRCSTCEVWRGRRRAALLRASQGRS